MSKIDDSRSSRVFSTELDIDVDDVILHDNILAECDSNSQCITDHGTISSFRVSISTSQESWRKCFCTNCSQESSGC